MYIFVFMRDEWKEDVEKLASRVGKPEAKRLLVIEGIAPGTAEKIVGDRYYSKPGHLVMAAIKRAIMATEDRAS